MYRKSGWYQVGREWLVALCAYALLVAPFGCELSFSSADLDNLFPGSTIIPGGSSGGTDGGTDSLDKTSTGLFLNENTSSPLVIGARSSSGDTFFVYGTRNDDGGLHRIDSILAKSASGEQSYIVFENSRPAFLMGPDGSWVRITYTDLSETLVQADITTYDASTDTEQSTQVQIDIAQIQADLLAAAGVGAAEIAEVTGRDITVPEEPENTTAKEGDRAVATWIMAVAVVPLVVVSQYMLAIMGQVIQSVVQSIQATMVAAFTPIYAFTDVLGATMFSPHLVPILDVFADVPSQPTITVGLL